MWKMFSYGIRIVICLCFHIYSHIYLATYMFFYGREVHKLNFKRVFLYEKIKYELCMYVTYEYSLDIIFYVYSMKMNGLNSTSCTQYT